ILFVNAQTYRTDYDWDDLMLPGLTYLAGVLDDIGSTARVAVVGPTLPGRIRQLVEVLGVRLCIATSDPLLLARRGKVLDHHTGRATSVDCEPPDAWQRNLAHYVSLATPTA